MVLVGQGLRATRVHYSLVCTPLAPYWNTVYLFWTRGKYWEIGNTEHLSSLHQWTLSQNAPVAHSFNTPATASVQPPVGRVQHP